MATYLSRSAWTSTGASGAALSGSRLRGVAVHWPGTKQAAIGDPGQSAIASRIRGYRDYHVNNNGWRDIGYNLAIDQAGRVWMLRSTQWRGNLIGAHCASPSNRDANEEYVGVLLLLGQSEQPTAKMIAAFRDWYHTRFLPGWPGRTDVRGHGQVPGAQTNCPGTRAKNLIADGTLTAKPTGDDDMPYRDWPKADRDALVKDVFEAVWFTDKIPAPTGYDTSTNPNWMASTVIRSAQAYARLAYASRISPADLATALAPLLPSGSAPTQEQLETALRNVLGSLDDDPA